MNVRTPLIRAALAATMVAGSFAIERVPLAAAADAGMRFAAVEKWSIALNTRSDTVCGAPSLSVAANGVRSTRYGSNASVCTPGIGRHSSGSAPPVKIHGKIGTTPAGTSSIATSPSRNEVLP